MSDYIQILTNPQVPVTPQRDDFKNLLDSKAYYCLSSSGSSSERIKWIVLDQEALFVSAQSFNNFFNLSSKDNWANVLPKYHISGLMPQIRSQVGSYQLTEWQGVWSPTQVYQFLIDRQINGVSVVPTQLHDWVQLKLLAPPRLKYLIVGGASISQSLFDQARQLGWPIYLSYGMTETSALIAVKNDTLQPYQVLPHVKFRAEDDGRLAIKSKCLFEGSLELDLNLNKWVWATANKSRDDFWSTSDQISEVDSWHFNLLGRMDEFIKIKGEGVYLSDIRKSWETFIAGQNILHPPLLLSCVHDRKGQELVVVVDPQDLSLITELQRQWNLQYPSHLNLRLKMLEARFWPRSALGKIQWVALKKLLC